MKSTRLDEIFVKKTLVRSCQDLRQKLVNYVGRILTLNFKCKVSVDWKRMLIFSPQELSCQGAVDLLVLFPSLNVYMSMTLIYTFGKGTNSVDISRLQRWDAEYTFVLEILTSKYISKVISTSCN